MRDKESGDNERKMQSKFMDKQEKFVTAAQAAESAAKLRAVRSLSVVDGSFLRLIYTVYRITFIRNLF